MLIQFKLSAGGITIYKKKYSEHRLWAKLTPLVKEWGHGHEQELNQADESIDMQDVRNRSGSWPIVEAAVSVVILHLAAWSTLASICVNHRQARKQLAIKTKYFEMKIISSLIFSGND